MSSAASEDDVTLNEAILGLARGLNLDRRLANLEALHAIRYAQEGPPLWGWQAAVVEAFYNLEPEGCFLGATDYGTFCKRLQPRLEALALWERNGASNDRWWKLYYLLRDAGRIG